MSLRNQLFDYFDAKDEDKRECISLILDSEKLDDVIKIVEKMKLKDQITEDEYNAAYSDMINFYSREKITVPLGDFIEYEKNHRMNGWSYLVAESYGETRQFDFDADEYKSRIISLLKLRAYDRIEEILDDPSSFLISDIIINSILKEESLPYVADAFFFFYYLELKGAFSVDYPRISIDEIISQDKKMHYGYFSNLDYRLKKMFHDWIYYFKSNIYGISYGITEIGIGYCEKLYMLIRDLAFEIRIGGYYLEQLRTYIYPIVYLSELLCEEKLLILFKKMDKESFYYLDQYFYYSPQIEEAFTCEPCFSKFFVEKIWHENRDVLKVLDMLDERVKMFKEDFAEQIKTRRDYFNSDEFYRPSFTILRSYIELYRLFQMDEAIKNSDYELTRKKLIEYIKFGMKELSNGDYPKVCLIEEGGLICSVGKIGVGVNKRTNELADFYADVYDFIRQIARIDFPLIEVPKILKKGNLWKNINESVSTEDRDRRIHEAVTGAIKTYNMSNGYYYTSIVDSALSKYTLNDVVARLIESNSDDLTGCIEAYIYSPLRLYVNLSDFVIMLENAHEGATGVLSQMLGEIPFSAIVSLEKPKKEAYGQISGQRKKSDYSSGYDTVPLQYVQYFFPGKEDENPIIKAEDGLHKAYISSIPFACDEDFLEVTCNDGHDYVVRAEIRIDDIKIEDGNVKYHIVLPSDNVVAIKKPKKVFVNVFTDDNGKLAVLGDKANDDTTESLHDNDISFDIGLESEEVQAEIRKRDELEEKAYDLVHNFFYDVNFLSNEEALEYTEEVLAAKEYGISQQSYLETMAIYKSHYFDVAFERMREETFEGFIWGLDYNQTKPYEYALNGNKIQLICKVLLSLRPTYTHLEIGEGGFKYYCGSWAGSFVKWGLMKDYDLSRLSRAVFYAVLRDISFDKRAITFFLERFSEDNLYKIEKFCNDSQGIKSELKMMTELLNIIEADSQIYEKARETISEDRILIATAMHLAYTIMTVNSEINYMTEGFLIDSIIEKAGEIVHSDIFDMDVYNSVRDAILEYHPKSKKELEEERLAKIARYNTLLMYAPDAIREEDIPDSIDD